jgi:hypothetical protein
LEIIADAQQLDRTAVIIVLEAFALANLRATQLNACCRRKPIPRQLRVVAGREAGVRQQLAAKVWDIRAIGQPALRQQHYSCRPAKQDRQPDD